MFINLFRNLERKLAESNQRIEELSRNCTPSSSCYVSENVEKGKKLIKEADHDSAFDDKMTSSRSTSRGSANLVQNTLLVQDEFYPPFKLKGSSVLNAATAKVDEQILSDGEISSKDASFRQLSVFSRPEGYIPDKNNCNSVPRRFSESKNNSGIGDHSELDLLDSANFNVSVSKRSRETPGIILESTRLTRALTDHNSSDSSRNSDTIKPMRVQNCQNTFIN